MRAGVVVALLFATGCGRIAYGFAPVDVGTHDGGVLDANVDGGGSDAGALDAGAVHPSPCPALTGAWTLSAPEVLTALDTPSYEGGPSITSDGLTLFFASDRDGGARDVYRSDRASVSAAWGAPVRAAGTINTTATESHFAVFADGLTAIVAREGATPDILLTTRATTADPWGSFTAIPSLSTAESEWDPWPSRDGLRIALTVTNLPGGAGGRDIAIAARASASAAFDSPVALSVSTSGEESGPAMTEDELFLVFVREDVGGGDLYYAERTDRSAPFGAAMPLPGVDTASRESETALAPIACELYFARDDDLFRARFIAM